MRKASPAGKEAAPAPPRRARGRRPPAREDSSRALRGNRMRGVCVDARSRGHLSFLAMSRLVRLPLLASASLLAILLAAPAAPGQNLAVGGGAGLVNDTAAVKSLSSFGTWGGFGFLEAHLEPETSIQLRLGRFSLPPSAEGGPNVTADHVEVLAQYLFDWDWFHAGFIGGVGGVRLTPKSLEEGQVPTDVKENVVQLTGGIVTAYQLAPKWDLRVEADFYWINSTSDRRPAVVSAAVAYHF